MIPPGSPRALVATVLALAVGAAQPAAALGIPGTGGGFSVSGKGGPFIKQVAKRKFDQTQTAGGGLGLSDAVNQGQFQAARLPMPQTEGKVRQLLDSIEAHWPYAKTRRLNIVILGLDQYNAYSLPDGSIVIGFGLLDRAESDDEVAFILAHELAHIRLGHFAEQAKQQGQRRGMRQMGQVFALGMAVRGGVQSGGGVGAAQAAFNSEAAGASRRANAAGDLLRFVNDVMVAPTMSRGQEDEADALGFDLTQARPYSAEAASARVFDTIQKDEDNREKLSKALDTQMQKELGRAVGSGAAQTLLSGGGLSRGNLLRGAGRIAAGVAGSAGGGPKHRSPEERKRGIADYSALAYPDAGLRNEERTWLNQVRSTAEYAAARTTVEAVRAAMTERAAGQYPAAQKAIARAGQTIFKDTPMVLNESARLHDDMGDVAGAERLFTQAHQSPNQTVDGYVDHVRMLYRTQRNDRALQVVDAGTRRFNNDDKPFLALLIAISRQAGRQQAADQYLKRCLSYDDDALANDCQIAAGDDKPAGADKAPGKSISLPKNLPFNVPRIGF